MALPMPFRPSVFLGSLRRSRQRQRALSLGALALAMGLAACSPKPPAPEPIRAVRTLTVADGSAQLSHEYAAEVRARVESRLGFRVGGKMLARQAEIGQRVKAGQPLAQLDPADLRLGQDAAQAAVRSAQVNQELAAADFRRYKELREQGFISAIELDRRQTTLQAANAQLEQARAQAGVQVNQAGYAALTAPAAGVITAVEAEPGTVLAAGTPVFRLAHDGPRDAVFSVPEDVAEGFRSLLGKPGLLNVRPWGGQGLLPATVREVAAAADPATRTFLVKADLGGAAVQLGQTLTVLVPLPPRPGVAKLPLSAVLQHEGKPAVWLVDKATMTVSLQPVAVGGAEGNSVIVTSGLKPGQTVVTAGVHVLSAGQKVSLYQGAAAGAGATAAAAAVAAPQAPTATASR